MEEKVTEILHKSKPDISKLSLKTYANAVAKVMSFISSTDPKDLYTKHSEIMKTLREKYEKPNTIKTKVASIMVLLKCLEVPKKDKKAYDSALEHYSKEVETLSGDIRKDLKDGEKSAKQKTNWVSSEEGVKLKEHLKNEVPETIKSVKDLSHFRNYVLYMLYDDVPTRNELADTKIVFSSPKKQGELSDEWNYIVLDKRTKKATYLMNTYKTAKSYGSKVIPLSDALFPLLADYKLAVDKYNGGHGWMFLNNAGTEKLSRNRLGVVYSGLGSFIGKKLGTTMNRHLAVSRVVPLDAMKELADKMGHSVQEQTEVYAKV